MAWLLVTCSNAHAALLFAYDGNERNDFFVLDTDARSATLIASIDVHAIVSEIEYRDGLIYLSDAGNRDRLHIIDSSSGTLLSTTKLTFPEGGNVITAMEFVGSTLYGGFVTKGQRDGDEDRPSILVTIDPVTGTVTEIGSTEIHYPLGGLAYDVAHSVMYTVSGGRSVGDLYTVDLTTGSATLVGSTGFGMSALEFGPDGVLYGLPDYRSDSLGQLLRIDTATGEATSLGFFGFRGLNSLTALEASPPLPIPEPGTLVIFGLGWIGLSTCLWRRRRSRERL